MGSIGGGLDSTVSYGVIFSGGTRLFASDVICFDSICKLQTDASQLPPFSESVNVSVTVTASNVIGSEGSVMVTRESELITS